MFKEKFKYYKSKNPPPDLNTVVDFSDVNKLGGKIRRIEIKANNHCASLLGLRPSEYWEIYELLYHPGLIFIKNPFTSIGQRYWTLKCLRDYSKGPNKSNLDPFNLFPQDEHWWDYCQNTESSVLLEKMRWVTLGYHHNWDTKVYSEDDRNEFPPDLAELSRVVLKALGFLDYRAEAAIVNYYHMDSTLSGHTDHSEEDLEAPLLSFSLGQTAVFLLGGKTKEEDPSAILLRSGDIVIMSKESRLCYHGVPKILHSDLKLWENSSFHHDNNNDDFKEYFDVLQDRIKFKPFEDYLKQSRINVNVRQVLKLGQNCLQIPS